MGVVSVFLLSQGGLASVPTARIGDCDAGVCKDSPTLDGEPAGAGVGPEPSPAYTLSKTLQIVCNKHYWAPVAPPKAFLGSIPIYVIHTDRLSQKTERCHLFAVTNPS